MENRTGASQVRSSTELITFLEELGKLLRSARLKPPWVIEMIKAERNELRADRVASHSGAVVYWGDTPHGISVDVAGGRFIVVPLLVEV